MLPGMGPDHNPVEVISRQRCISAVVAEREKRLRDTGIQGHCSKNEEGEIEMKVLFTFRIAPEVPDR